MLSVNDFRLVEDSSEFDKSFIKRYNEESDEGHFLEVDMQCLENLHNCHNDLSFLRERIKIEKIQKLVANWHKTVYVIHIRNLKQALNHGLVLKKVHRVIKLNKLNYHTTRFFTENVFGYRNEKNWNTFE